MRTKKIMSVFMALAMVFAMCLGAFGSVSAIEANDLDTIQKHFYVPDGVGTPAATFTFEFEAADPTQNAPDIKPVEISYKAGDEGDNLIVENNYKNVVKASTKFLKDVTFDAVGTYYYTLKETGVSSVDTIEIDRKVYDVAIETVLGPNGNLEVKNIEYKDQNGSNTDPIPYFENTYAEKGDVSAENAEIRKTLEVADGVTIPKSDFTFEFTRVGKIVGDTIDNSQLNDIPIIGDVKDTHIGTKTISFLENETDQNGEKITTKSTKFLEGIDANQFKTAGVYKYTVKEQNGAVENMVYSQAEYDIYVYVVNSTDTAGAPTLAFEKVRFVQQKDQEGGTACGKNPYAEFVNKFTRYTNLTIEKKIEGQYADLTKVFEFNIKLNKASTTTETEVKGLVNGVETTFTYGKLETVYLSNGGTVIFENLPVGTTYTINDRGANGYKPSYVITTGGKEAPAVEGTVNSSLEATDQTVGETGKNSAVFTNTFNNPDIPTGIFVNNLPFIMLIVVAVGGFIAYIAIKRRKMSH